MIKRRFKYLFFCFLGSCFLVALLYGFSAYRFKHPNGFLRKLPSHVIVGTGFIILKSNSWYISGSDSNQIYLGNTVSRNHLFSANYNHKDTLTMKLVGMDTVKVTNGIHSKIAGHNIYLMDGIKPTILIGRLAEGKLSQIQKTPHFVAGVPLSPSSLILRVFSKSRENILIKLSGGKVIRTLSLGKRGEGIFPNDGLLFGNQNSSLLFYSYYYRNQYLCIDTNLNIIYKGKTIDTVSHVQIKVGKINSLHEETITSPPVFVKKQCSANDKYLFVHSTLKSDNEIDEVMKSSNPIDIYSIKDVKYQFSFYLPNIRKEKLKDFSVHSNMLVALYDHYLYFYRLTF